MTNNIKYNYSNILKSNLILNMNDEEIINMINNTNCISTKGILIKRQYSEEVLLALHGIADSWEILKTQHNLSPYFCFKYLYDCPLDSADDWTSYDEIVSYLKKEFPDITQHQIEKEFNKAMNDRKKEQLYGDYDIKYNNNIMF
jgi:spore coat polysaccharide biosynthesis protein SpsF (cytidylyltransferase family)